MTETYLRHHTLEANQYRELTSGLDHHLQEKRAPVNQKGYSNLSNRFLPWIKVVITLEFLVYSARAVIQPGPSR